MSIYYDYTEMFYSKYKSKSFIAAIMKHYRANKTEMYIYYDYTEMFYSKYKSKSYIYNRNINIRSHIFDIADCRIVNILLII